MNSIERALVSQATRSAARILIETANDYSELLCEESRDRLGDALVALANLMVSLMQEPAAATIGPNDN